MFLLNEWVNLSKWFHLLKGICSRSHLFHLCLSILFAVSLHPVCSPPWSHAHATASLQSCSLSLPDWFKFSSRGLWLVTNHPMDWLALSHMSISCMSKILVQMPRLYEFKGNRWVLTHSSRVHSFLGHTSCQTSHRPPAPLSTSQPGPSPTAYYQQDLPFYLLLYISFMFIHTFAQ